MGGYFGGLNGTFQGVFYNRSSISLTQMASADGTSTTLLFGETLGDTDGGGRQFALSWIGAGWLPTAWGLPTKPQWYTFGSKHSGIVQFCYGDGSVHGLRKGSDSGAAYNNYIFASGWMDGRVVDESTIN